jgi:N-acetylglucosamine-6-phosphate deacetylase
MIIAAHQVVTAERVFNDHIVRIEKGRIIEVRPEEKEDRPAHRGSYLIPGMIDLHTNGAGGADAADGRHKDLETMSETLAQHGCTSFLPTIITGHPEGLVRSLADLAATLDASFSGAKPLGIHLEGPFISPEQRGVHRSECIQPGSREVFETYYDASGQWMKMLTLAPERPGCMELIPYARERLPIVSLGHTAADHETALEAFKCGANLITHVFNAMDSLHHRKPGLLGAALVDPSVAVELIADGVHVHSDVVRVLFRIKGAKKVILVTDAMSAAGMPDGRYRIGNLEAIMKDGICRDEEGRLCGSTLQMDRSLQLLREWLLETEFLSLSDLVNTATLQPAQLLGLKKKGEVRTGFDADLVLMDEDFSVLKTWVEGDLVFQAD